jgi:hypothetical protein
MAVPTETYVDPSIAGNSGAGTIGDPYGDFQYALDTMTRDGTNGDRINIKAGTDEILAAAISLATYGVPTLDAPLILRGYTTAAGDGGKGAIDCNTFAFFAGAAWVSYVDLVIHNSATTALGQVYRGNMVRCEMHNITGSAVGGVREAVCGCSYFHDISGYGVTTAFPELAFIYGCYFKNGTKDMTYCINGASNATSARITHNVCSVDGATNGIQGYWNSVIYGNSIFSNAGTGTGILIVRGISTGSVHNNLIEGFSGAGGIGISTPFANEPYGPVAFNSVYNCTTDYNLPSGGFTFSEDNESLGASPFAKSGSDTYALRSTYFAPQDTGNVLTGFMHNEARGAIAAAGGGGGLLRVGMSGGMNG